MSYPEWRHTSFAGFYKPVTNIGHASICRTLCAALVACLLLVTITAANGQDAPVPQDWRAARAKLDAAHAAAIKDLAAKCDELKRPEEAATTKGWIIPREAGRQYVFLIPEADPYLPAAGAPGVVTFWHKRFLEIRKAYAAGLFEIAHQALDAGDLTAAWQMVYETLREDPDHPGARKALGFISSAGSWLPARKVDVAKQKLGRPRLGWPGSSYWQIDSEHFSAVTNAGEPAGRELVGQLEQLYTAWEQIFVPYWATKVDLASRMQSGPMARSAFRKRKVVLFKNRAEYIAALKSVQPKIEITHGLYLDTDSTVYLYAGDPSLTATWRHEATHQLFHESRKVPPDIGARHNFWAIEGAAMYMESMSAKQGYAVCGGLDASRLQFSRDNWMRGGFYVRQVQFVSLSRGQIQQDKNIGKLYSQGAGLAHFLMDAQDGKYRTAFGAYLDQVYAGNDTANSLSQVTGVLFPQLDQQYADWLRVTDDDLAKCPLDPMIRNLCLNQTRVTAAGIKRFPAFSQLEWADFSQLPLDDQEASRILVSPKLRQLSLEKTPVGDAFAPALAKLTALDELDLSETKFTDAGLAQLAGLKKLKTLWMTGTKISDASIPVLSGFKDLEVLELDGTAITAKGIANLRAALPKWKEKKQ